MTDDEEEEDDEPLDAEDFMAGDVDPVSGWLGNTFSFFRKCVAEMLFECVTEMFFKYVSEIFFKCVSEIFHNSVS